MIEKEQINSGIDKIKKKRNLAKEFFSRRQHPVIILKYAAKYLWLLVIPLAKYLIATKFNLQAWIRANWIDILTVSVIIGYAFLRWVFVYFKIEENAIIARTGYFGITRTVVYFNEISSASFSQGVFFRVINACSVYIDTDAKSISSADISLNLTEKQAFRIYGLISEKSSCKPALTYKAGKRNLLAFSFVFSSALSGVALALTAMYEVYNVVGRETEELFLKQVNERIENIPAISSIPKYILWAGIVIAGGWLLSFTANLMRHWNFTCQRRGDVLFINSGIGTRRRHILYRNKINYTDFQQSMLMKLFNVCSVSVNCTGYGKRRGEISALAPVTTGKQAANSIKILMPHITDDRLDNLEIKTGRADVGRYITIPIIWAIIPSAVYYILAVKLFPDFIFFHKWEREIRMCVIILTIPLLWRVFIRLTAAFTTGMKIDDKNCTLSYCRGFKFHKVVMDRDKIVMVRVLQNPFQIISRTCNVYVYSRNENTKKHILRGLNYKKVTKLLEKNGLR